MEDLCTKCKVSVRSLSKIQSVLLDSKHGKHPWCVSLGATCALGDYIFRTPFQTFHRVHSKDDKVSNKMACNLQQKRIKLESNIIKITRPSRHIKTIKTQETSGNVTTLGTTLCRPQFPKSSPQAVKLAVMLDTWCWHCQHTETESTETTSNSTRRVRPSHTLDLDILDLDLANSLLWPKKFGHVIPVIPSHAR